MPIFRFTAVSENGSSTKGSESALSEADLAARLEKRGLMLRECHVQSRVSSRGWSTEQRLFVVQEWLTLAEAGMMASEIFRTLEIRPEEPALQSALEGIRQQVESGASLSDAFRKDPRLGEPMLVSALETAEAGGDLVAPLRNYLAYLERRADLERKLRQAATYPVFLMAAMGLVVVVLVFFVMPRFVALYRDFDAVLPLPTRILLGAVHYSGWVALAAAALVAAGIAAGLWRRLWSASSGRLPILGPALRSASTARLSRGMSMLLKGGSSLPDTLDSAGRGAATEREEKALAAVKRGVEQGKQLSACLLEEGLLDPRSARLLGAGENSGRLADMLEKVADHQEARLDHSLRRLASLVEPVLILITGLVIGVIVVALYLPVLQMSTVIR